MADPVNHAADAIEGAGKSVVDTTKSVFNGAVRIAKPVLTVYGGLSAYSMLDGGVGALANVAAEGATRADMLQVPLEGLQEFSADVADAGSWLSQKTAEIAAPAP